MIEQTMINGLDTLNKTILFRKKGGCGTNISDNELMMNIEQGLINNIKEGIRLLFLKKSLPHMVTLTQNDIRLLKENKNICVIGEQTETIIKYEVK